MITRVAHRHLQGAGRGRGRARRRGARTSRAARRGRGSGARVEEGRGADADRARAGEQHLDRVDAGLHAAGADDRHAGQRARRPSCTARSAIGLIAGPDSPPPPPPSTGRRGLGVDEQAQHRVHEGQARRRPASTAARGDRGEIGHVGRQLGEDREPRSAPTTARDDLARSRSGSWRRCSCVVQVRAAHVDLDRDDVARAASISRRACEVVDRVTPHRRDHACAGRAQRGQVVREPRRRRPDPGARPR